MARKATEVVTRALPLLRPEGPSLVISLITAQWFCCTTRGQSQDLLSS